MLTTTDMVGLRDLITPLSGRFAIRGLALATVNLPIKFEVSNSTHYKDMTGDTKCLYSEISGLR